MELLYAAGVWWILLVFYAVILALLPFFIIRIRNEVIQINRTHQRILALLEAVIPKDKKPKPPAEPEVVYDGKKTVRICPDCQTENEMWEKACTKCQRRLL